MIINKLRQSAVRMHLLDIAKEKLEETRRREAGNGLETVKDVLISKKGETDRLNSK